MERTKMNEVTKSNVEVMVNQLHKALAETMAQVKPLAIEEDFKYSKEQLVLEGRASMLATALNALQSFLETSEMSPTKYEELIKGMGKDPQKMSTIYRGEVSEYFLLNMDEEECVEALSKTIAKAILS